MSALPAPAVDGRASEELVQLAPDYPSWRDFVARTPEATVFHLPAWTQVIADTYRYPAAVLAAVEAGRVVAGVPVVRARRLRGPAWVSLPFSDHSPPLAVDPPTLAAFSSALARWSERGGLPLEVRGEVPPGPGWRPDPAGARHVLALETDVDRQWRRVRARDRQYIKVAGRGLRVRFGRSAGDVDVFYRLHVHTRRRQGVPVQPRRFVRAVADRMLGAGHGVVAVAETPAGEAVAAAVLLAWNGTAILKWLASDARRWDLRANHVLMWESVRWAVEGGNRVYDLGKSEAEQRGLHQFKEGFGARRLPLVHSLAGGPSSAAGGHRRAGDALALVIRRSPTIVCRTLGLLLYRYAA